MARPLRRTWTWHFDTPPETIWPALFAAAIQFVNITLKAWLLLLVMISPFMALITLIGLPFLLPMKKLGMRTLKRSHRRQKQTTVLIENLLQIFSGVRTVKAFGTERERIREFRASDEVLTERALKVQRAKSTSVAMVAFINNVLAVALICGGGWLDHR